MGQPTEGQPTEHCTQHTVLQRLNQLINPLVKEEYMNQCAWLQSTQVFLPINYLPDLKDLPDFHLGVETALRFAGKGKGAGAFETKQLVKALANKLMKNDAVRGKREKAVGVEDGAAIEEWIDTFPEDLRKKMWVWFHTEYCTTAAVERCGKLPESACKASREKAETYCKEGSATAACTALKGKIPGLKMPEKKKEMADEGSEADEITSDEITSDEWVENDMLNDHMPNDYD